MSAAGAAPAASRPVEEAARFCRDSYRDTLLDPLRNVIALDAPPTLEMQSNPAHLTAAQRKALDAFQPLYTACRDRFDGGRSADRPPLRKGRAAQ